MWKYRLSSNQSGSYRRCTWRGTSFGHSVCRQTYKNYALIAGFAETGETIEETVLREVKEETGITVKNLEFYKSQPWGFSDSLLFGFFCDLDGTDELIVDKTELATALWVQREDLPDDEETVSLTMEMMTLFKKGDK